DSVTSSGVESSSSVIFMVPSNGMLAHIQPALVAIFIKGHQDINILIKVFVTVPFVRSFPWGRQKCRTRMAGVHDINRAFLDVRMGISNTRMVAKIPPYHFAIPRPFVFGVGCGVYTHKTTTGLDVALEISLLIDVQNVTRRT